MANLLEKASILLTPTAYDNGRMLAIKPDENLYGAELVTNGDFATDTDWGKINSTISGGVGGLDGTGVTSLMWQDILTNGKKYEATFTISNYNSLGNSSVIDNGGLSLYTINSNGTFTFTFTHTTANGNFLFRAISGAIFSIDNVSVKEDLSGDFTFSRNSAATRVNAQGLVENVQILSSDLVSNGDFSQEGTEEISNGSFSQEGVEGITNGDFATDSDWSKGAGWSISGGTANAINQASSSNFSQDNVVESGKIYVVTFTISNYIEGSAQPLVGGMTNTGDGTARSGNGTYTEYVESDGTRFYIRGISFTGSIDNISVKEVGQDWAFTNWSLTTDNALLADTSGYVYQTNVFEVGKSYKVSVNVKDYTSGNLRIDSNGSNNWTPSGSNSVATIYISNLDRTYLLLEGTFRGSITNISVKEVGQDWTLGTGWSIGEDKAAAVSGVGASMASSIQNTSIGRKFKFTFQAVVDSGVANAQLYGVTIPVFSTSGFKEYIITSTSVSGISFYKAADFSGSITNISVIEITDDTNLPRINYEGFSYQDALGSEEIVNGDFSNGSTDWNLGTGWSVVDSKLYSDNTQTSFESARQTNVTEIGKEYRLKFSLNLDSGVLQVKGSNVYGTYYPTDNGEITLFFTADNTAFRFTNFPNNTLGSIDNVSIKEYLGQEVVPDSGCGSWLMEGQSTNLVPYSSDFSNSIWVNQNLTINSNVAISPDGTLNASKIIPTTSNTNHLLQNSSSTSNATNITSIFVKADGYNYIQIGSWANGQNYINFDLQNGTVTKLGSTPPTIYGIESVGNGWYRIWANIQASGGGTIGIHLISNADGNWNETFVGDGINGVLLFGTMIEVGSFPTSYIPTQGAISTRLADIASNSGNASLINSEEGVLYAEISTLNGDSGSNRTISLSDSTNGNQIRFYFPINIEGAIISRVDVGGSTIYVFQYSITTSENPIKIAFRYSSNGMDFYVNGSLVSSSSLVPSFTNNLNSLQFRRGDGSAGADFYGKTKGLAVFKTALTDEQLTLLTTI
jgi:hypothetical protein